MVQVRMPASAGRAYYDKKIAEGKSPRAAARSLKRPLSDHVWRIMLADEKRNHRQREMSPTGRLDNREAPNRRKPDARWISDGHHVIALCYLPTLQPVTYVTYKSKAPAS